VGRSWDVAKLLKPKEYQLAQPTNTVIGVDAGATLVKIATRSPEGALRYQLAPATALSEVVATIQAARPERVGLTGGGATKLEQLLGRLTLRVNEFAAWGNGAAELLQDLPLGSARRYLLVSLGTGTSVMLVDGMAVNRIGGTALGGGTVVGLGAALLDRSDFSEIAALAENGDRRRVDLLVSDIYRAGEIPLLGELTAASFGKLARLDGGPTTPAHEDLAHAVMGLVGENVALICAGLGAAHQVDRVVFGGSTLRKNPTLREVLQRITAALGLETVFLPDGEFAGALGALRLACDRS
jgi:type II pantothenate kinase